MQNLVQYYHLKQTLKEKLQKVDNVIIYLYFVPVKLINLYKLLYLKKNGLTEWSPIIIDVHSLFLHMHRFHFKHQNS